MRFLRLSIGLVPERSVAFPPNPVNTLRGALGFQLKKIACFQKVHDRLTCHGCPAEGSCVYAACFETGQPHGDKTETFGANLDLPHLMVLEARFSAAAPVPAGTPLNFGVTLFGRAVEAVPWLVQALRETGRLGLTTARIPCRLERITAGEGLPIYDSEADHVRPWVPERFDLPIPDPEDRQSDRLSLRFLTPTSFKDKATGHVKPDVDFHRLWGSLCRRFTAFWEADRQPPPPWDFGALARLAREVRIVRSSLDFAPWERYSTRQEARIKFGGVIGTVSYEGPLRPFHPLLEAGQILCVGRGTSFGQGRYTIEETSGVGAVRKSEPMPESILDRKKGGES